jgi:hypothetical protein
MPSNTPTILKRSKFFFLALLIMLSTACLESKKEQVIEAPAPVEKVVPTALYSVAPIAKPSRKDIRFAQSALTKVGYNIGPVDGIWGKRSSAALISFENKHSIWSADGYLSEQNLHTLEVESKVSRQQFERKVAVSPKAIAQLLNKRVSLKNGPQLIILERSYLVMSKPNPYSSKLQTLTPGTGIYVIARQDSWYQIETLERQGGYVKVD